MKIGIFGAGSWGTALAMTLVEKGHEITIWSNDPAEADKSNKTRSLVHKLPEISVPDAIKVTARHQDYLPDAELLVVAVPSKLSEILPNPRPHISGRNKIIVCATKGMEQETLLTMSDVLDEIWNPGVTVRGVVALSGPSHAEEVARNLPTAVVSAHENETLAQEVQEIFQTPRFRVYTNTDRRGVEPERLKMS